MIKYLTAKNLLLSSAIACIGFGILITIFFVSSHSANNLDGSLINIDYEKTAKFSGALNSLIGPLISTAGFFFLYLNFKEQSDIQYRNRLESKFFQLVGFHRANVSELTFTSCEKHELGKKEDEQKKTTAEKRKVFKVIYKQFEELYNEVGFLFNDLLETDIYEQEYLSKIKSIQVLKKRNFNPIVYAKLDLLYLMIFFGIGEDDAKTVLQMVEGKYKTAFVNKVINFASFKPKKESSLWPFWVEFNKLSSLNKVDFYNDIIDQRTKPRRFAMNNDFQRVIINQPHNFYKYYGGHQFSLGHYFRNIFRSVNVIHESKLAPSDKEEYVNLLRAQLSNVEQVLFFLNSVSQLGRRWELENASQNNKDQLITNYNLIKNIPNKTLIENIEFRAFYPDVQYEILVV